MSQYKNSIFLKTALAVIGCFISIQTYAGLAVSPGVTTDVLDKIDQVQDENLREMLKAAIWPGFGERYMNLDRPEEELSTYEKNYKEQPLTWDEKIENVRYILNQADDPSKLTTENIEYMDISFGESVIPVADRRVTAILNTNFLEGEIQKLAEEKQKSMAALYDTNQSNIGDKLQLIEDEYAIKLATLVQAENEYKEAKVAFLKLKNQKEYGRIDEETYQEETRAVVEDFETYFEIGSEVAVFDDEKIKQLGSSIYDDSIQIKEDTKNEPNENYIPQVNEKAYYWTISVILMLIAILFGYLAFRRLKHTNKKSNF
ncbi:hypothetical protein GW756_03945 [bacterium]|nr:hypothetical protein [bacterium]NCQ55246.1 hypothetical protein [Candidatus Parcubacteria bacterium]NCS67241.1 hypothetical protein [Candidatus Peregrinibacteria bacterium]NCS96496.1 hypothetical protein [bacterium]